MSDTQMARQGGIQSAIAAMVTDARRAHEERLTREAARRLIRDTDEMIAELEELNLRGVSRVSGDWRPRLVLLLVSLPFPVQTRIPPRATPTRLLDILFDIQEELLTIKITRCEEAEPEILPRSA